MKKAMKIVLAVAMVLLMSGGAMAQESFNAQGSALVPNMVYSYNDSNLLKYTSMYLSNITSSDVQCKVTVYDHNGNDVTYLGTVVTGGNGVETVLSKGSGEFAIPAHSTRCFTLGRDHIKIAVMGYAVVEWKSSDTTLRRALIGGVRTPAKSSSYHGKGGTAYINGGQPF
ncbi:hypothetical protein [Maridesulfovibrio salexigens]|uniref:Uncharacterized protein n=1 Tax=Maridesulfovibrio salexigens (strain ATCC 14822 / DSM 2638 / NCIMB 8403 / VKM B-1763) TaxID=526222 RepID=C6BYV1_MARSD|nr:hypothetical protein [Maridesulfovibrio salexigens]ACS80708.1 conserved hypothetical protein [Maridesulfovibrio salexigens DSM 2638]